MSEPKQSVTKRFTFESSHRLPKHDGKCKNYHGHSYKLFITVSGEIQKGGPKDGMIIDFSDLSKIVKEKIIEKCDHKNLNKVFPKMTTTVENLTKKIFNILKTVEFENGAKITQVVLYETEDNFSTFGI